jgi:Fe2+ or Zn2+ uptake regulation protein
MSITTIPDRRTTKQRTVILDIVRGSRAHPDAEEVYRLARRRVKSLSLGTVYRNLKLLSEEGLIREIQLNGKSLRFDGMMEEHQHFLCAECHKIIDLPRSLDVLALQSSTPSLNGFKVQDYRLDIYGVCPSCASSSVAPSAVQSVEDGAFVGASMNAAPCQSGESEGLRS